MCRKQERFYCIKSEERWFKRKVGKQPSRRQGCLNAKLKEGKEGKVGAFCRRRQSQRLLCIAGCISEAASGAVFITTRILIVHCGLCCDCRHILFFVYVLVVRFTLLWRWQGETGRIPRHVTSINRRQSWSIGKLRPP